MRARLALQVSRQSYRLREVRLKDRPKSLYDISPKGTVPVMQLADGTVIEESIEIMHWSLGQNDPQEWLPSQPDEVLATNELLNGLDVDFKPNLDRYKYANRYPGAVAEEHRAAAVEFLMRLEERLASTPFLMQDRPRLADMALAPFVRQFAMADKPWFDEQPWPGLSRWLERFLASPIFAQIMPKREFWAEGTPDLMITPIGK
jgi:glutathione S-transferase